MVTASINEDAECQHEDITKVTSANREEAEKTHLIDMWLKNKSHYCLQLERVSLISKFLIVSCIFLNSVISCKFLIIFLITVYAEI